MWAESRQEVVSAIHFLPVSLPTSHYAFPRVQTLKVIQVCASITANEDDEAGEFYNELGSTLIIKSTYSVMTDDFCAKRRSGGKAVGSKLAERQR